MVLTYQSVEHGDVNFSANGSPATVRTFALIERQNTIVYATAHSTNTDLIATVVDVTKSSIQINVRNNSATNNFSAVTTAAVRIFYQVVGSSP